MRFWWFGVFFFLVGEGGKESHLSRYLQNLQDTNSQVWPTPKSSPSSNPFWTLHYSFAYYLEPNQRLMVMGKHEREMPFVLFSLSAILPYQTSYSMLALQCSMFSGVGSSDQERKDRRWELFFPGWEWLPSSSMSSPNS